MSIKIWQETVTIPTYPVGAPDRNPMFLEKRVNQGTSGRTYPMPVITKLADEKVDRSYQAVWLENEFVRVMVLPELGGRIQIGQDKTNGYDFFYRNNVIKPALIGLAGPWISGGVEFNWPQHHRPTTFCPMDYHIEEHPDGSKTVWMGEIEPLYRMKGMVGITLHPGKSWVEARGQIFNRTPHPQPFMWWANVAVQVHDDYQAFFPTDVHYVTDHARRAMSAFPLAKGEYYGVDYSQGVDITWTKNMLSAGSYFIVKTDYDFFGGYDHARQAGLVNVANRFIAPGKKMFNWGNCDFGHSWQRNLTDADGEYVELMAGVYTDNQPDFSWLQPFESRTFSQFWYPTQRIGPAHNANLQAALSLTVDADTARIGAHAPQKLDGCALVLRAGDPVVFEQRLDLGPQSPFVSQVSLPAGTEAHNLLLSLYGPDGNSIISYRPPEPVGEVEIPEAFKPAPWPAEIATNEELYLTGLHLEQYRHPTRDPEPYYQEALRRDPGDARCNNAMGLFYLRRYQFTQAEEHFRKAIERLTRYNPNPYDGEPYYNLGLALVYQGRAAEAYPALYKATWNQAWAAAGYTLLAALDCRAGDWSTALTHLDKALVNHSQNLLALNLKAAVLRRLSRAAEALALAQETHAFDPLDYSARYEIAAALAALGRRPEADAALADLDRLVSGSAQAYIELAWSYTLSGLAAEAVTVLNQAVFAAHKRRQPVAPLVYYLLAARHDELNQPEQAAGSRRLAAAQSPELCFPARLEEMLALQEAITRNEQDARAPHYLGNLLYDRGRHQEALRAWETARERDASFSTTHRNLALAYYNDCQDAARAQQALETAFRLDPSDARVLYELNLLLDRQGVSAAQRLELMESSPATVRQRDDLFLDYIALHNATGRHARAVELLGERVFHPWEGGEGSVNRQHVWAHLALGHAALRDNRPSEAIILLRRALEQPKNYGEGGGSPQAQVFYWLGQASRACGQENEARDWFEQAAAAHLWRISELSFFQGLALRALGEEEKAAAIFNKLVGYAQEHIDDKPTFPYFAASMPLFLMSEGDLEARNLRSCHLWMGLGYAGLGQKEAARSDLAHILPLAQDPTCLLPALEPLLAE